MTKREAAKTIRDEVGRLCHMCGLRINEEGLLPLIVLAEQLEAESSDEADVRDLLRAVAQAVDVWLVPAPVLEELERKAKLWDEHMAKCGETLKAHFTDDYPPKFKENGGDMIREPTVGPRPLGGIDAMSPHTRVVLAIEYIDSESWTPEHRLRCAGRLLGGLTFAPPIDFPIAQARCCLAETDRAVNLRLRTARDHLQQARDWIEQGLPEPVHSNPQGATAP